MGKVGRDFSTSQLKEYPSALAKAMADLARSWVHASDLSVQPTDSLVEPADSDLVAPFKVNYTGLFERGADTRGHL